MHGQKNIKGCTMPGSVPEKSFISSAKRPNCLCDPPSQVFNLKRGLFPGVIRPVHEDGLSP